MRKVLILFPLFLLVLPAFAQDDTPFLETCDQVELPVDVNYTGKLDDTLAHYFYWTEDDRELSYDFMDGEFTFQFPDTWRTIPDGLGYALTSDQSDRISTVSDLASDDDEVILLLRPPYAVDLWTGYAGSNPPDLLFNALNERFPPLSCIAIGDVGYIVRYEGSTLGVEEPEIELIAISNGEETTMAQVSGDYDNHQEEILGILSTISNEPPVWVASENTSYALRLPPSWVTATDDLGVIYISDKARTIENFESQDFGDDDLFVMALDSSLGDYLQDGTTSNELDTLELVRDFAVENYGVQFTGTPQRIGIGICVGDSLQFHKVAYESSSPFDEDTQIFVGTILEETDGELTGNAIGMIVQVNPGFKQASEVFELVDDFVPEIYFSPEDDTVSQAC